MSELTLQQIKENIYLKEKEIFKVIALFTGFRTETVNDSVTKIFIYGKHVGNILTVENERSKSYSVEGEIVGSPHEFSKQITEGLKLYTNLLNKAKE